MGAITIPQIPQVTNLTGDEKAYIVQNNLDKSASVNQIADFTVARLDAELATIAKSGSATDLITGTVPIPRLPVAGENLLGVIDDVPLDGKGYVRKNGAWVEADSIVTVTVVNDAARLALTIAQVQNGDYVKVTSTGIIWEVTDDTKLSPYGNPSEAFTALATITTSQISDSGATGRAVVQAGTQAQARTAIGMSGAGGVLSGTYPNPGFAVDMATQAELDAHANNTNNPHNVTKAQVGLGNVDNTSDLNKPISTATQTALNAKAPTESPTFTGTLRIPSNVVGPIPGSFAPSGDVRIAPHDPVNNIISIGSTEWSLYAGYNQVGMGGVVGGSTIMSLVGGAEAISISHNTEIGIEAYLIGLYGNLLDINSANTSFNGDVLFLGSVTFSNAPFGSGVNLINLNASNISSGTLNAARIADNSLSIAKTSGLQAALDSKLNVSTASSTYQPLDSDLTAIAALTTTSFGRSLLTLGAWYDAKPTKLWDEANDNYAIVAGDGEMSFGTSMLFFIWEGGAPQTAAFRSSLGLTAAATGDASGLTSGTLAAARLPSIGNITNAGAIGSTSGLPIITGASGVLQAGSFGTTASTFAQGNDSRIVGAVQTTRTLTAGSGIATIGDLSVDRTVALTGQALALHNLASDGLIARTGAGTVAARTLTGPAAGITVSNGNGVSGNPTLALANDLNAIEALALNGIAARTATDTWAIRSLTAPAAGITISNNDAVAGNPTFALANDLLALESLASTGMAVRTAADTWTVRSLAAPAAGFTITNPDGVSGNPTFVLSNDLSALEGLASTGIAVRTGTDTWNVRSLTAPAAGITISNNTGVAGNPTFALANDLGALEALSTTGYARRSGTDTWVLDSTVPASSITGSAAYEAIANSTGNSTITPAVGVVEHSAVITFTGTASTRIIILATTNRVAGDIIRVNYTLPTTANIIIEARNATSGGTLLDTLTTDASGDGAFVEFTYTGSAWIRAQGQYPAA